MTEEINQRRRRLFGTAAMSIAVAQLGLMDSAVAQSGKATASKVPALKTARPTVHRCFSARLAL